MAISITLGTKQIELTINCVPTYCNDDQARRIILLLRKTVLSLAKSCQTLDKKDTLGDSIMAISDEDLRDIWQWNSNSSGDEDASSGHFNTPVAASQDRLVTTKAISAETGQLASEFAHIITSTAAKTWIIDMEDCSRLVPIGCTGELVLECSTAGLDCVYSAKNITTSSIDNPSWLLDGGGSEFHGRHGRIYQTGVLAKYDSDGYLVFVGHKAAQKKLQGQPVDLDKLESRMREVPPIRQAVCLIPTAGPYLGKLVGFFSLQRSPKRAHRSSKHKARLVSNDQAAQVRDSIQALEASMDNSFPAHMVPSVWIALEEIHVNPESRLSRKVLEDWIRHVDVETCADIASAGTVCRTPTTAAEKVICHACSLFLGIPESNINIDRSFIANGGDSMSAMRVSPHCRAAGFAISVASLLKKETLIGVAASATVAEHLKMQIEEFEKPFCLSPMQQWFFNQSPPDKVSTRSHYCNQASYLQLNRRVSSQQVATAVQRLVHLHTMLRARFQLDKVTRSWSQLICKPENAIYHFTSLQVDTVTDVENNLVERHQELNIEQGKVFAVDLFTLRSGDQFLTLIAHHLVVDLISWRIILDDLEVLLNGGTLQEAVPFQVWNHLQIRDAGGSKHKPVQLLSTDNHNNLNFWAYDLSISNTFADHVEEVLTIDHKTTALLLGKANGAYNTEPVDLILASLWIAFLEVFKGRDGLTIFIEGHGREFRSPDIDISRTVGWFTTLTPLHISRCRNNDVVRAIKDSRRMLPSNGREYFASRYFNQDGERAFQSHEDTMEMLFNYHGHSQLQGDDSMFKNAAFDNVSDVGLALPTSALFSINVSVQEGLTDLSFSWNRWIKHQKMIRQWLQEIPRSAWLLCSSLSASQRSVTIADYEFLHLDYKALDQLQDQILPIIRSNTGAEVDDVFPCWPMVDGMLLSQGKDSSNYKTSLTYEVTQRNQILDIDLLEGAWQAVIARHPAIRSVFVEGIDKRTAFVQIVLGHFEGEVIVTTAPTRDAALISIDRLPNIDYQRQLVPPHRLVLYKVKQDSTIICHIEMSHAITDGISTAILLDDWSKAYNQRLDGRDLLEITRSFARHLNTSSEVDKLSYWKHKLTNVDPCVFPMLSQDPTPGDRTISVVLRIDGEKFRQVLDLCESQSVTPASLFSSVWALTLAAYTSNDQVCFGYTASGRDLYIPDIDRSVGAFANLLICQADTSSHALTDGQHFVQNIHAQLMRDLEYQRCSLADIKHELGLSHGQALFNTIVSFQNDDVATGADVDPQDLLFHEIAYKDPTEVSNNVDSGDLHIVANYLVQYDISLGIAYGKTQFELSLDSHSLCLSTTQAESTLSLLESILMSLVDINTEGDTALFSTIDTISTQDLEEIWTWNHTVPDLVNVLVHDLISKTVHMLPSSPAVCAWDGDWTYQELGSVSSQLAHRLISMGVGPEKIVGLCFEKCRWTPIAVLAVMKAGGVSLILDLELTEGHPRIILEQAKPTIVLSSAAGKDTAIALAKHADCPMLVVDELNLVPSGIPILADFLATLSDVKPSNTLYIVFTSGSTGVPKGVSITHSNFSSSIHYLRGEHAIESRSRVYDFASYSFDMSWSTMLWTLECGACLCIPSWADRRDKLAESIDQFGITHLLLTPTVAQLLPSATLRGRECLVLGGEALTPELSKVLASTVKTTNHYGPCECTPVTVATKISSEDSQVSIGRGVGVVTWVVDTTRNSLVPLGCVGELLLEGPLVGPGYLNPELTAASFFHDPPWLLRGFNPYTGRRGRLYRTGDLVRYNHDGTLSYLGRKDSQIKINGQRIELGSIEHCIRSCIEHETAIHVVVEHVKPRDRTKKALVAFLSTEGGSSAALRQVTASLSAKLAGQLPEFMVPSAFIWTESFPAMVSGKIDRGKIRGMYEQLSRQEINAQDVARSTENTGPMTNMERELAALWSTVLEVPSDTIRTDDSFIHLGGDSVGAMKLTTMARDNSFKLSVTDILRYPSLADQSQRMRTVHNTQETVVPPFSLLPANVSSTAAREQIAALCGVATRMIEDAFPCTPLQEGLLALTLQRPGSHVAQWAYELRPDIDLDSFRQAWDDTIAATPILRTRIVDLPGSGMMQVVIAAQSAVLTQTSQKIGKIEKAELLAIGLGTSLMSSEIRTSLEGHSVFFWTVHHALYDGWSIPRLMRMLETAYAGVPKLESPPPFQNFVKFIHETTKDAVSKFWTSQFKQLEAQIFPFMSSSAQPRPDFGVTYQIPDLSWPRMDTTAATTVRAALAILIATYTDSSEAIFGVTVNGRHAPVHGIENIIAPTIATVPLRVKTSREDSISQLLHQLQTQMLDITPFEHTGLQEIRKISKAARHACDFQTLLLVHSAQTVNEQRQTLFVDAEEEIDRDTGGFNELVTDFDTYAFTIECDLEANGALLRMKFDSQVISRDQVGTFAMQLESIIRKLCSSQVSELTIGDLRTAGHRDLDQIWKWNAKVPATIDLTVHGIIAQNVAQYPHSPAICAWDGHWTYQELDSIATQIALKLVSDGYGPNSAVIPICFEKSRWTPVAMLAVMKAGCTAVILDTTLPLSRLEAIVREIDSPVILSSLANLELAKGLTDQQIIVLCEETLRSFDAPSIQVLPIVDASANLYLVFTSGSTGTPKAAVITHSNFSSAIYHQQAATGFNRSSRVCDLAKYAFDISWSNFVHTLAAGGCICIPSQLEISNDLAGALLAYEANFIDITPSVAGVLQPSGLSSIQTVVFAGEPLPGHIASQWATYARVLNMFGPAECTVKATMAVIDRRSAASSAGRIGRGLGLSTWVVDSQDHQRLITIGAVGELLLEGPLVGAGYFRDIERTKASFVDSPEWLTYGNGTNHKGRQGRLYKTGDLVSYNSDGSLNFIGRKDTQTKINGQRLELGDVEHNLIAHMDVGPSGNIAAEVLTPSDSDKPMLVAFVQSSQQFDFRARMIGIQDRLAARLPAYMIPSAYITIEELPLSSSGKMDRKQLRAIGATMTRHELTTSFSAQTERRTPSTDHELSLQKLWSEVLNVLIESIAADDSFLQHGGDSIQAMKLTMRARHEGLDLSVADILGNVKLSQMALRMQTKAEESRVVELDYQPFSLLPPATQQPIELQLIEYSLSLDNVLDIFPVTDQQTRYLLSTYTTARSSVFYHTMDRDDEFDLPRIQHALVSLLEQFDMLRTVVIPYKNMFLQIVLGNVNSGSTVFETGTDSLDEYTLHLKNRDLLSDLHFGDVVTKMFIVRQTRAHRYRIVIRLSHFQYDGIALEKMWTAFESSYNSSAVVNNAIPSFAHHLYSLSLLDREKMSEYWSKLLKGSSRTELRHQTTFRLGYATGPEVVKILPTAMIHSEDFTFANMLTAAWAYVLARHLATKDVVFGSLVHGRSQAGSQDVFGACVNIIPYRIIFGQNWTARDLLTAVAAQQLASTPFESMGSQSIIRNCTNWAKWSFFSSVIVHQNLERGSPRGRAVDWDSADLSTGDVDDVQVYVISTPGEDGMEILLSFKDQVVSQTLAERMASDLSETITRLYTKTSAKLIAPKEMYGVTALLPEEKSSSVSPTSEQLTTLANCSADLRAALGVAWCDVLSTQKVPCDRSTESLFDLGGDASTAAQLAAHMQRRGYRMRIEEVIEHPSWFELLLHLSQQQRRE